MECIEARALKSSFMSEVGMKSTPQVFFDDLWCMTGINSVTCDDFSVDDLLDLSDKDFKGESVEESEEDEEKDSLSVSSQDRIDDDNSNSSTSPGFGDFGAFSAGDLSFPVDDLENLEWLSQIVDDSVSELSLLCPFGNIKEKNRKCSGIRSEPLVQKFSVLCFPYPVPTKPRTKPSRPSGRVWPLGSLSPSLTESFSTSSSSHDSSLTSPLMFTPLTCPVQVIDSFGAIRKPPAKKHKRNPTVETGFQTQRRCSHCQVQKTPQWRTGPFGPKTLCNACGVRFKSGRLYPEYRPACSPTFSGDLHSNSHRKVLEMRRKKENIVESVESGLTPMVPSFLALD